VSELKRCNARKSFAKIITRQELSSVYPGRGVATVTRNMIQSGGNLAYTRRNIFIESVWGHVVLGILEQGKEKQSLLSELE
jgi:hypothetical protein